MITQKQQVAQPSPVLFPPSPLQLTCATYPISGILNDQPLSCFVNQGFPVIYNFKYEHYTTSDEINEIRNGCGGSTILCMGGLDSTTNILLVVACGYWT